MDNIIRLEKAILNGGTVACEGIVKRVLVESGNGAAWYIVTMADGPQRTRTFTVRREDAKLEQNITGQDFSKWAARLEQVSA